MSEAWAWLHRPSAHDLPLLLLGLMAGLSLAITPSVATTLPAALWFVMGLVACALAARWPRSGPQMGRAWAGACVLTAGLIVLGLWGLQDRARPLVPQLGAILQAVLALRDRVVGQLPETVHPNVLAGALVVLTPFCLAAALRPRPGPRSAWHRILGIITFAVWLAGCMLIALTQSRGAYLGLASGLLVVAVLWPRSLWLLAPCAALGGVGMALAGGSLDVAASGLEWRTIVWDNGLRILSSFPFTGVGMGCFRQVTNSLFPMAGLGSIDASHAHNLYLQIGIDLGIPGLVAYLACLGLSFYLLVRAYRAFGRRGERGHRLLAAAALAALTGLCMHGLVDVGVWGSKVALLPWAVIGLSAALERFSAAGQPQTSAPEAQ